MATMTTTTSGIPAGAVADSGTPVSTPPAAPLACCWSESQPSVMDLLVGGLFTLCGLGLIFWGLSNLSSPNGPIECILECLFGGLFLAAGLGLLLHKTLIGQRVIGVTESGIEVLTKRSTSTYRWEDIHKVLTLEFFPHRDSARVLLVTVEPRKGSEIKFDTTFGGEPDSVLNYLLTRCDYLVSNPRAYTKRTV